MFEKKIATLAFGAAFLLTFSAVATPVMAANLSAGKLREFSENNILYYDPSACLDGALGLTAGKLAGTGNFAKILSAKNAEKSFF